MLGLAVRQTPPHLMDPDRGRLPGARFAKRRILELNARRDATSEAIAALDGERPGGSRPAEIEAMLDPVPDLTYW